MKEGDCVWILEILMCVALCALHSERREQRRNSGEFQSVGLEFSGFSVGSVLNLKRKKKQTFAHTQIFEGEDDARIEALGQ